MFGRMLIAGGMVWRTLKPSPHPGDRYELIAVVVNLTGKGDCARDMTIGTAQWKLKPCEVNLETLDADKVLDEVASGSAPKEVLAWIPLMKNGSEDATITRWLQIVNAEPSLKKRGDYALARIFSGAVGLQDEWKKRLEGLTMIDSPVVKELKDEAFLKGKAESVIDFLQGRFAPIPEDILSRVRTCNDAETLRRWLLKAGTVTTLEQFRLETGL
jgi:hypothetical protein